MRVLRLARIAAEAEVLRLRRIAVRTGFRAAYGVLALVFVIAALCFLHVALWIFLVRFVGPVGAALIVVGVDLLIAVIFGALAARSAPDKIEQEAIQIRRTAVSQMKRSLTLMAAMVPVTRQLRRRGTVGKAIASLTDLLVRR
ncbi:MAG: hypothetical protein JOZ58_25925 [Acetobacteraceae bacterium]|nr:hypothetical protein [Acetobacteraceae bacterium]MBV8578459.1 hypothetical protein [Acetobacteraceae bacterium]